MNRTTLACLIGCTFLLTVAFAVDHPVVPASGYWYSTTFTTPGESRLWISMDIGSLEWKVDRSYNVSINLNASYFDPSVDRFYNIMVECRWLTAAFEDVRDSRGPYELSGVGRATTATFDFFPTKGSYWLRDGESKNGVLQYKVTFTEGVINGTDSDVTTDWQHAFDVSVSDPTTEDVDWLLIGLGSVTVVAVGISLLLTYRNFKQRRIPPISRPRRIIPPEPTTRMQLQARVCRNCQTMNEYDAEFCKHCGRRF